jgi:hypothetical protein
LNSESAEALAEILAVLAAEREITRVLYRYCHAVDRHDMQELLSVYHPDAADEHGSYAGDAKGFVAYLDERMPRVYQGVWRCRIPLNRNRRRGSAAPGCTP